jgi:hypothetical protein
MRMPGLASVPSGVEFQEVGKEGFTEEEVRPSVRILEA